RRRRRRKFAKGCCNTVKVIHEVGKGRIFLGEKIKKTGDGVGAVYPPAGGDTNARAQPPWGITGCAIFSHVSEHFLPETTQITSAGLQFCKLRLNLYKLRLDFAKLRLSL
ncbi:MAG: hypothetical protein J6M53_05520, partial [Bacteroidaceae bacterium]|nr:hypothetical protein [Bacteroidaceae bacterium]